MLATFFIFLFIIFSTLLAIGIFTYIYVKPNPSDLKELVTNSLSVHVRSYNSSAESKKRLDSLRDEFKCCGSVKNDMVEMYGLAMATVYCKENVLRDGCATKAFEQTETLLKKYLVVIVGVAFGIAVVMLLGMIFSMLLCCAIRETM
jgi:hypothetical protein